MINKTINLFIFTFIFFSLSSEIVADEQNLPTVVYIVRHGQTDWNFAGKVQGLTDVPLNDTGRLQAAKVAAELADIHIDMAFSSNLMRAYETSSILVNGRGIDVISDERIREKDCGSC